MIKYTTLRDIMKFIDISEFLQVVSYTTGLGTITGRSFPADVNIEHLKPIKKFAQVPIEEQQKRRLSSSFQNLKERCLQAGLSTSAKTADKIISKLQEPVTKYGVLGELCKELEGRLIDEMQSMKYFTIELDKQALLLEKNLFGEEVALAFPSATIDIEEAGKCFAFERYTACVFHLMRGMEVGLRALEKTLGGEPSINPSWEKILEKCGKEQAKPLAERAPEWQKDPTFFAAATAMLRSVKGAWRNPTMHIEKVYTEEQAEDIWNASKGFMRHLATKLKEDTFP